MALVKCSECGTQVSTSAAACPKCGAPVGSTGIGTPLSTIQQTSKRLKVHIIFSSLFFWIGTIWLIASCSAQGENPNPSGVGITLVMVGVIWFLVTKFRIWWHHK